MVWGPPEPWSKCPAEFGSTALILTASRSIWPRSRRVRNIYKHQRRKHWRNMGKLYVLVCFCMFLYVFVCFFWKNDRLESSHLEDGIGTEMHKHRALCATRWLLRIKNWDLEDRICVIGWFGYNTHYLYKIIKSVFSVSGQYCTHKSQNSIGHHCFPFQSGYKLWSGASKQVLQIPSLWSESKPTCDNATWPVNHIKIHPTSSNQTTIWESQTWEPPRDAVHVPCTRLPDQAADRLSNCQISGDVDTHSCSLNPATGRASMGIMWDCVCLYV